MQQASTARQDRIQAQFLGHHSGEESHFLAVGQQVLTVAGAKAQTPQKFEQALVEIVDPQIKSRLRPGFPDQFLYVFARLLIHLFYTTRVNAAIDDQLF